MKKITGRDDKMNNFTYKDVYTEDEKRILEINILPEKCCNFDCIFLSNW